MKHSDGVRISASSDVVWEVFTDVERWPEWTESVTSVEWVEGHAVVVGAKAAIKQPKLPKVVWEVTEVSDGASWTWVATGPGATTIATHHVRALDAGTTEVTQSIEQRGPIGSLIGLLSRGMTKRYVAMEAAGLKARCEHAATGA